MCEYVPDKNLLSVVMNGNNETVLISSDIEDREMPGLVRGGKRDSQMGEGGIISLPDNGKPVVQRDPRIRMCLSEFGQPPSGDDMHTDTVSQYEIRIKIEQLWSEINPSRAAL